LIADCEKGGFSAALFVCVNATVRPYAAAWGTGDMKPREFEFEFKLNHRAGPLDNPYRARQARHSKERFHVILIASSFF
jgi:hypothetical protein